MFAYTLCLWLAAAGLAGLADLAEGISLRRGEYRLRVPVLDLSDAFADVRRTLSGASIDLRLGKDKEKDVDKHNRNVYYTNFVYPLPPYPAWPAYPIRPPRTTTRPTTSTPPMTTTRPTTPTANTTVPTVTTDITSTTDGTGGTDPTTNPPFIGPPRRAHLHEEPAEDQWTAPRRRVITYVFLPNRKFKIEELTPAPSHVH